MITSSPLASALETLSFSQLLRYAVRFAADRDRAELRLDAECGRKGPEGWVYDRTTGTWASAQHHAVLCRSTTGPFWEATVGGQNRGGSGRFTPST